MKAFFKSRQHSKADSYTSNSITHSPTYKQDAPPTPTEWWLARENAFDTAHRVYEKLYRNSDESYYSREQDYDEDEENAKPLPPLSPSSPEWNASYWFWSVERSEMWVDHVANSDWCTLDLNDGEKRVSADTTIMAVYGSKPQFEYAEDLVKAAEEPEVICEKRQTEVKSTAAELSRRPKLTIQIPSGIPTYYSEHGPNDYSSCRPHITSEERAEWRKNMF
ncbi:hypothetical protein E4T49_08464 [Aureobasidium sp. EXF-10728]|nr:hypothetical protein E4T49_08464 [Aureobasidium sp. EXF-10728]